MATNNSASDDTSTQPQWYWLSGGPEGFHMDDDFNHEMSVMKYNPPAGWQPYSEKINEWLERGLSYMKKSRNIRNGCVLRIGLSLPLINGRFDYSWSDMAVDFCNGIVMIDSSNYVNINEMKQYDRYNAKKCKQVKRERTFIFEYRKT
jgi:hypothetical protein